MSRLSLYLLGPPRVERDGVPVRFDRRKATALLAYFALVAECRRDTLAALFWPEYDQSRAHAALRRTLAAIKQGIGSGWLNADRQSIGLAEGRPLWADVTQFHELLARCHAHHRRQEGLCTPCLDALSEAAALYRDDFLTGFSLRDSPGFDDWQRAQSETLHREVVGALNKLVRGHIDRGDLDVAIGYAQRWLALEPMEEGAHLYLMRLYAWTDQRAAALGQYQACAQILEQEVGLSPSESMTRLCETIRADRPLAPLPLPPLNLPHQVTSFIGREAELAEIESHLADPECRLLALVGPGGIGKTRLALEAAAGQQHRFVHGVHLVSLASVHSVDLLVPTIARAIGFPFGSQGREEEGPIGPVDRTPQSQLLNYLWDKETLLVLDSFEHLIGGANLLAEMLSVAPGLKLLVTSRERLNLRGEWVIPVDGLPVPEDPEPGDAREVESYDAIRLCLSAARRIDPGFSGEAGDLIRICRLLDGTPLAIELVASWARTLSCAEITAAVERAMARADLDFFTARLRDAPARHQSMRAVFEYSWNLLSEGEQAAMAAVSVFRGGFERDAAPQVGPVPLPILSALVDKSLVHRTAGQHDGDGSRYDVHELLRQYAEEKLGEGLGVRDRHCKYYARYLEEREARLRGPGQSQALEEIEREIDNVRAAWQWATRSGKRREIGRALESLFLFYETRSRFQEGETTLELAVDTLGSQDPLLRGRLLARLGRLTFRLDEMEAAQLFLEESADLLRRLDAPNEAARALMWLGDVARRKRKNEQATSLFERSLSMSRDVGDRHLLAESLCRLADSSKDGQAFEEAKHLYQRGLAIFRELGNRLGMADALVGLADIASHLERTVEAKHLLSESLAIRREMGDRRGTAWCLHHLAECARCESNFAASRQLYERSLVIHRELGDALRTWNVLHRMVDIVYWQGGLWGTGRDL